MLVRKTCSFVTFAIIITAAAFAATTVNAQQAAKSERLMVTIVNIKPESVDEYEAFVRNETNPALQRAGVKWRRTWKTAVIGNAFEYIYVQPLENFSEFDGPGPIERALGKDGNAAWNAKSRRFLTSVRRMVINTRPDLSYDPGRTGDPAVAVVTHATAAQGRNAEVEKWVTADLLPAMRQAKVPGYSVSQVHLGGNANEYITLVHHNDMAEIEKGPPVYRVMSKEAGDRLYAKLPAGALTNVIRYVVRYAPDLSFKAVPVATK